METITGVDVHEPYSHLLHLHGLLHLHKVSVRARTATEAAITAWDHHSTAPVIPKGWGHTRPPPPHSPRGDAIYPSPINRAGSPWAKRQEGRPFSPTPPCVPQLLLGGCAPPAPPAPEDPLPSLRGPGGTPAAPLSPEGARSPRLPWRGEKKPPLRGAPSLRAP